MTTHEARTVQSIDSPEFRQKLATLVDATHGAFHRAIADLVADIDAWGAAQREEGRKEGFEEGKRFAHEQACRVTHALMTERDEIKDELASIKAGVEGMRWCYKAGEVRKEREAVWRDEVLVLFAPQGQEADESGLPG